MSTADQRYIDLCAITSEQRINIIERMEKNRPELFNMLATDPFIEAMQKQFGASVLIEKRIKHMIVIHYEKEPDEALVKRLKKWFEATHVILNWNGEDRVNEEFGTLLFTSKKPPYKAPYSPHILPIENAQQLLRSTPQR
ncbi:MAG: hypothetical protein OEY66_07260 [Gammaproteobacteria bacterium]|nr:hypothetical protein [Gammaproteobacteria bacterium]